MNKYIYKIYILNYIKSFCLIINTKKKAYLRKLLQVHSKMTFWMQHNKAAFLHHFLSSTFKDMKTSEKRKSTPQTTAVVYYLRSVQCKQTATKLFCAKDGQDKKLCHLHFSNTPLEEGSDSIAKITACFVEIREDRLIARSCHSHQKDG